MANSLINGTEGAMLPSDPPAPVDDGLIPTWGYRGDESQIFNLKPGEALPDGWADSPVAASPAPKPKRAKKAADAPPDQESEPEASA